MKKKLILAAGVLLIASGMHAQDGNVVSQVNSHGHYVWIPSHEIPHSRAGRGRQNHPFDFQAGNSRWMAHPAAGGGIRCLVRDITTPFPGHPMRAAGFDIQTGPIGIVGDITIESETLQTASSASERTKREVGFFGKTVPKDHAILVVNLVLDKNQDGAFTIWENQKGNTEKGVSIGGDQVILLYTEADGTFTINDSTLFRVLIPFAPLRFATWGDVKDGILDGINGATHAVLTIGVVDKAAGGTEEVIVKDVDIEKGPVVIRSNR